jgi:hypothetical protein
MVRPKIVPESIIVSHFRGVFEEAQGTAGGGEDDED